MTMNVVNYTATLVEHIPSQSWLLQEDIAWRRALHCPSFCLNFGTRIWPSPHKNVWGTRPRFHWQRGAFSSITRTTSPGLTFGCDLFHFLLSVRLGTYSRSHLFQKWSVRNWDCLQRFLEHRSLLPKTSGDRLGLPLPIRLWLGVVGSESLGSTLACVSGRLLRRPSTSVASVSWSYLERLLRGPHHSFPHSPEVRSRWRIENPLDSILCNCVGDFRMVQSVVTLTKFPFSANKISAVNTANEPWLSSSTNHSS